MRAIGVSNYLPHHLDELCAPGAGDWARLKPEVNQFELHPMLQQPDIVDACTRYGIVIEAYSSLGQVSCELNWAVLCRVVVRRCEVVACVNFAGLH